MGRVILITGGARSGKSSYGQSLAESMPGPRLFIATAVGFDEELLARIAVHRRSRENLRWSTAEETHNLSGAIAAGAGFAVILVDCLTMWVNNLLWNAAPPTGAAPEAAKQTGAATDAAQQAGVGTEEQMATLCREVLVACRRSAATVIFVTNEVGMGIVPGNAASRLFRDLLGRCNQIMAGEADAVVLMISGLPLVLKDSQPPLASPPGAAVAPRKEWS